MPHPPHAFWLVPSVVWLSLAAGARAARLGGVGRCGFGPRAASGAGRGATAGGAGPFGGAPSVAAVVAASGASASRRLRAALVTKPGRNAAGMSTGRLV